MNADHIAPNCSSSRASPASSCSWLHIGSPVSGWFAYCITENTRESV